MNMKIYFVKILAVLFVFLIADSCTNKFQLDPLFKEIKNQAKGTNDISEFKELSLDSALLKYDQFPNLLVEAVEVALKKPELNKSYLDFLKNYGLGRYNKQDGLVLIAIFHQRLNNKLIDVEELKDKVYEITPYDYPLGKNK